MLKLRTTIEIQPITTSIKYEQPILLLGSCFAQHIGKQLKEHKLSVIPSPNGILYNPASIAQSIHRLHSGAAYDKNDPAIFNYQEKWISFDHHGDFSKLNQDELLQHINEQLQVAHAQIQDIQYLILTLGTAYVYELKTNRKVVANCHQLPAKKFTRYRLSVSEVVTLLSKPIIKLQKTNPQLQILLTVSPIRHWKDGAIDNQRSKSTLLLAVEQLCQQLKQVHYFPSYEIMMDELRDYRFYASDMLHPSEVAIQYIWQQFKDSFFKEKEQHLMKKVATIRQAFHHRPRFPKSQSHQQFCIQQLEKIKRLKKQYPFFNWEEEEQYFSYF